MSQNKKAPWMERYVQIYVHPKYFKLFIADCFSSSSGKSERGGKVFKSYYDKLPKQEQQSLLSLYDEMTEEQRKNPKRE